MKKTIFCSFQIEGIHNWKDIPNTPDLSDVQYLIHPHRHIFNIKCFKLIDHNNRDIEFIHFKHTILKYFRDEYYDEKLSSHIFNSRSCEMIAEDLIKAFDLCRCEVDEDGENGSVVEVEL